MDIKLDASAKRPLYLQLRDALRTRLLTGVLPPGGRLPATRELAKFMHISRNTVEEAYRLLEEEGLITVRRGQGAFASARERIDQTPEAVPCIDWQERLTPSIRAVADYRETRGQVRLGGKGMISFASLAPDHHAFEVDAFRHALDDALLSQGHVLLSYGYTRGYEPLREYIAGYLGGKGLRLEQQETLIVNGFRQGAAIILRALCSPGDCVAVESPTYNGFLGLLKAYGLRAVPIPCDEQGMQAGPLEELLTREKPKLVYIVPTYHNPTGRNMPLGRRQEVLGVCRRLGVPILEDGFSEELRFAGESYPALKALPGSEDVLYVGSFSKVLFPGLRIGWVVAPKPLVEALTHLKYSDDISTAPLVQAALCDYLKQGGLDRHLRRSRPVYRSRMEVLHTALDTHFAARAAYYKSEGGFGAWLRFPEGFDAREALTRAQKEGVLFVPGDAFFAEGGGKNYIRLGFSRLEEEQITQGTHILSGVIAEMGY